MPGKSSQSVRRGLSLLASEAEPLFILSSGAYLTRKSLDRTMKSLVKTLPDHQLIATHSFRIGGKKQLDLTTRPTAKSIARVGGKAPATPDTCAKLFFLTESTRVPKVCLGFNFFLYGLFGAFG